MQKAIFAAGCFWGVEAAFRELPGVIDVACGYIGGHSDGPNYQQVCTGLTGHAEAVEVQFDPAQTSFEKLLEAFWRMHDPTTPNRQGPDVGSQYRSALFCVTVEQQAIAEQSKQAAQARFSSPVVTEINSASTFWRAEEYHQRYFEKNGLAHC
jgi:peptide-methionine (S)-S-oxide reductase